MAGPLGGVKVLEFAGIGPCPFAAMVLADLGADVLRVERPSADESLDPPSFDTLQRGKRSVVIDLRRVEGVALALTLATRSDVLLEGFRPGVMERLGLGPDECRRRNDRLVYGRMTGWGQSGPLAQRAGHDINYVALSGALWSIGRAGDRPVPPLNLVGDFGGGGMALALGVVAALLVVSRGGDGQVVDAAMVDGAALLTTMFYGWRADGRWRDERGANLLDSGAPFYEVYECADGRMIAVGAIEPQFYAALIEILGLDIDDAVPPPEEWPALKRLFAARFLERSLDEWLALAAGRDVCLAPVLSMDEAPRDPHAVARGSFVNVGGVVQPAPAPRFSGSPTSTPAPPCRAGDGGRSALAAWAVDAAEVEALVDAGTVVAR